jgi:hypothetical protein
VARLLGKKGLCDRAALGMLGSPCTLAAAVDPSHAARRIGAAVCAAAAGSKTKTAERLEALRRDKEEAETRECTFKPAISKRSDKLMADRSDTLRSLNVSAHQQLYQDSLRRQQK